MTSCRTVSAKRAATSTNSPAARLIVRPLRGLPKPGSRYLAAAITTKTTSVSVEPPFVRFRWGLGRWRSSS